MSHRRLAALLLCLIWGPAALPVAAQDEGEQATNEDSLRGALANGRVKALLRYNGHYRDSNLHLLQDSSTPDISDEEVQQYTALGGFVGFETAPLFHTTIGATVYGAMPFGNNPDNRRGLGGLYEVDGGQDAYAVLGEAFVKFQKGSHMVKAGRQEMPNYRMVSLSNIRFSPITHSGVVYENHSVENLAINLGYVMRMKERNAMRFIDMARGARVKVSSSGKELIRGEYDPLDYGDNGYVGADKEMTMLGLDYQAGRFSVEGWNYYVNDFVNSLYLSGQYRINPAADGVRYTVAAQYTQQWDVGGHIAGNIDTWHYGLSLRGAGEGFSFFANYNEVAYNEASYDGGTLFVRWGTPQMFNSFQVQDSELAGTKSVGIGFQYDFGRHGLLPGVVMRWRYGAYDLPDKLILTDARQDRREVTFDLRYSFKQESGFGIFTQMQGLSLQFRLGFNNYRTDYNFEAYRAIHGYDFESVTSDFIDTRLYLDYLF